MRLIEKLKKLSINRPNEHAVVLKKKITYYLFWKYCCSLAFYLKKNKYSKVCILEDREKDYFTYISMFATLLSGGTYIPLNKSTPRKRLEYILKESGANLLISKNKIDLNIKICMLNFGKIQKLKPIKNFNIIKSSKDAYIIFTSGTTGKPKGVRISRKSLDHYVTWITKKFYKDYKIRCSQQPGIGFDLSVADIYGTICSGGTLYPVKDTYDSVFLNKFIRNNNLTHWVSVPSAIDIICNKKICKKDDLTSLKKMFFCGEVLKKIHVEKIFNQNKNIKILNTYGPTETTVSCTELLLTHKNYKKYAYPNVSIGKSIKNMQIGLMNKSKKNEGELYISGPQLSPGYLNNEKLNNSKFIKLNNKKVFVTGDICKITKGKYYFLNRKDRQIKLFGNRIELNEIDCVIGEIFKIISYSVVLNNNIITFIERYADHKKIKIKLLKHIPEYMMPKRFITVSNWPRNKNFKIDEKKLLLNNV